MATALNTVISFAIANEAYTRESIITVIRSSLSPELNTALDCCFDEGTLDKGLQFLIDNPHYYPEAQVQNNVHNHHVLQRKASMVYAYGCTDFIELVPAHLIQPTPTEPLSFDNALGKTPDTLYKWLNFIYA